MKQTNKTTSQSKAKDFNKALIKAINHINDSDFYINVSVREVMLTNYESNVGFNSVTFLFTLMNEIDGSTSLTKVIVDMFSDGVIDVSSYDL